MKIGRKARLKIICVIWLKRSLDQSLALALTVYRQSMELNASSVILELCVNNEKNA